MIITPHVKDVIMDKISLLEPKLTLAVEKWFDLTGEDDVAFTIPEPVLYTKGEAEIQIEIRYTAGEDEYNRGRPFNPSLREQEGLSDQIRRIFIDFFADHSLGILSLSVWCKPYYHGTFKKVLD